MPPREVQYLQASWWPAAPNPVDVARLMQAVSGQPAQSVQQMPGPVNVAVANLPDRLLRVQSSPGRVDLFAHPIATGNVFPLFTDLSGSMGDLRSRCDHMDLGDVSRLAVICTLSEIASSSEDAIVSASHQAGMNIPFSDGSDFVCQINRRTTVGPNKTPINRVIKWYSENFQALGFTSGSPQLINCDVSSLMIDVNTVAGIPTISTSDIADLFDGLMAEVDRFSKLGSLSGLL